MTDLSETIIPKSDQLNADDLLIEGRLIKVTKVTVSKTDQPVSIYFDGDNNKPYKPSKSMRRVLAKIWGLNGEGYVGKFMRLYRDPTVKFGKQDVGGIKISHMSDFDGECIKIMLTVSRGKKALHEVKRLNVIAREELNAYKEEINLAEKLDDLNKIADSIKSKSYVDTDDKKSLMLIYKDAAKALKDEVEK